MTATCSVCAGDPGPDAAVVCAACCRRHGLAAAGPPVRATGEFLAAQLAPELGGAPPVTAAAAPGAPDGCTWCDKPAAEARKLLGNGRVAICDGCVALCADVLDAELGSWR